jgi:MFS family permease
MLQSFLPKPQLDEADVNRGLRALVLDAVFSQTMMVLTTGAFLIGFALAHGASNTVIGILGGMGPLAMVIQVPAVWVVQRFRHRKAIVLVTALVSRAAWLAIAFLPFIVPAEHLLQVLLPVLFLTYALGNVCGCAFNSWIRDLVPEGRLVTLFSRRLSYATLVGALVSLAGGFAVDYWKRESWLPGGANGSYTVIFVVATLSGMAGVVYLWRTPEPRMPEPNGEGFFTALRAPLHDRNFRQLLVFLSSWNFALNFATPFFSVYLLQRLGLSMSWVIGLTVFSQLVNVVFFRYWAAMADRLSNKSVLLIAVPLFTLSLLLWPFTTMPNRYMLTIPLLVLIHVVAGIGTAGVTLCGGNLAFKLAPYGQAGAYLAVNSLVSGIAATVAPVIAGFSADWFNSKHLALTLKLSFMTGAQGTQEIPTLNVSGLDFIFLTAFVLGLYAIHRLLSVREKGTVKESEVRQEALAEMLRNLRQVSTVAGIGQLFVAPFAFLSKGGGRNTGLGD